MRTVQLVDDSCVRMINQRLLPREEVWLELTDYRQVAGCICDLTVRGAPAIGVAAAFGLVLAAKELAERAGRGETELLDLATYLGRLETAAEELRRTRPTAVNLFWAIDRMMLAARAHAPKAFAPNRGEPLNGAPAEMVAFLAAEAQKMADEDVDVNRRLGHYGQQLIRDGDSLLTHCNAGALATVDYGTALGVFRAAHNAGKRIHVYVDETRPVLQGARLTAWEMLKEGIPATLITDNMAGHFMRLGGVQAVFVGADRMCANGDFANKIGTYGVAVLAREHGIPFYPVVPTSTIDLSLGSGEAIPIEERKPDEVTHPGGVPLAPEGIKVANPAFDVTPHKYITGIVTEKGVIYPPFDVNLRRLFQDA